MSPLFLSLVLLQASSGAPATKADAVQAASAPAKKLTFLVVFRPGPAFLPGKPLSMQPLKEHFDYMVALYAKGTMKQAGPFPDSTGGAVVLEVDTFAEAKAIVTNDPAVLTQVFVYDLHPWAPVGWDKYLTRAGSAK